MPTSKARKRRIVAVQRRRQKDALSTKTRLGLKVQSRSLKKNSAITNAIAAITECMKNAIKSPDKNSTLSEKSELMRCDESEHHETQTKLNKMTSCPKMPTTHLDAKETVIDLISENYEEDSCKQQEPVALEKNINSSNESVAQKSTNFEFIHLATFPLNMAKSFIRILQRMKTLPFRVTNLAEDSNELSDLKNRVSFAEREIQMLKETIQNKCENCNHAQCKTETNKNHSEMEINAKESTSVNYSMPPAAPPPPPPLPPPPVPVSMRVNVNALKRKRTEKPENKSEKSGNQINHITADQILKVKLKRVSFEQENVKKNMNDQRIVTLEDLQNVKLRKRSFSNVAATPLRDLSNCRIGNIDKRLGSSTEKRTPLARYNLRKTLKKVDMLRSPGGTPLVKSKMECGQGVTPLLAGALRRKFQNVNLSSTENSPDICNT